MEENERLELDRNLVRKYIDSVRQVLIEEQEKLDNPSEEEMLINVALERIYNEGSITQLVSRPIKVGKDFYKIGIRNGAFKLFNVDNRPFYYAIADKEDEFWREFLEDEIMMTGDIVDFQTFYLEIFNGFDKTNLRIGS